MESIFNPREVKFNDIASSSDFNKMNKEISTDFTNLFQNLATNSNKLNDIIETLQVNNQQLANRISYLETQINNMNVDKEYIDFYRENMLSYGSEVNEENIPDEKRAYINNDYNVATLNPIYQDSKTFLYNKEDDEFFLPDDLMLDVSPNKYTNADMYENDISKGFDQDISSQWKRKVIYPSSSDVTSATASVTVKLPKSIINNMYANTVYINPYPDASIDITAVEYKLTNSSDFQSFSSEGVFEKEEEANSVMVSFEAKPIEEIKITLEQTNAIDIDNGNQKMFMIGLQNVGIYYTDYVEESSFYCMFEPGVDVNKITEVNPIIANTINDRAVTFELYAEDLDNNTLIPISIGELISTNYNEKFWVKVTINKVAGVATPVLKGLTLDVDLFGSIKGVVKSSLDDSPINDATVTVQMDGDDPNRTDTTNTSGGFEINNIQPGNYTMKVEHVDYITAWYNCDVNINRTTELELIVQES